MVDKSVAIKRFQRTLQQGPALWPRLDGHAEFYLEQASASYKCLLVRNTHCHAHRYSYRMTHRHICLIKYGRKTLYIYLASLVAVYKVSVLY